MKTTKFLCLIDQSYAVCDELHNHPDLDKIYYSEESHMSVIEFKHENMEDNKVTLFVTPRDQWNDSFDLYLATDGMLYYLADYWSKTDLINKFE